MQWWGSLGLAVISTTIGILAAELTRFWHSRAESRRKLSGWSATGIKTYNVALVTSEAEQDAAAKAARRGGPSQYAILRMLGGPLDVESLRHLLEEDPYLTRCPTPEEREALERGLRATGRRPAAHELPPS